MASGRSTTSDTDKLVRRYVLNYLFKNRMFYTADSFREEAGIGVVDDVYWIDKSPKGILHEWMSSSYDNKVQSSLAVPIPSPSHPKTPQYIHDINLNQCSLKLVGDAFKSDNPILSCHFSFDGKLIAGAGCDKVFIYNAENYTVSTIGKSWLNGLGITDVRFKSGSHILATCVGKSVNIWDVANPSKALFRLNGHKFNINSLDFHHTMDTVLASSSNDVTALWNVQEGVKFKSFKGASKVRFQPSLGMFIAIALRNSLTIIDMRTWNVVNDNTEVVHHGEYIRQLCWEERGNLLASVSVDCICLWSVSCRGTLNLIKKLSAGPARDFRSCVFHPKSDELLVIGCLKKLMVWDVNSVAIYCLCDYEVVDLTSSAQTNLVACAGCDINGICMYKILI